MENNGVWRKGSGPYLLKVLKQKREVQFGEQKREVQFGEEFQFLMKANHLI